MRKFIRIFGILLLFLLVTACSATKTVYVPTDAETIIEYRDTTIYLRDTVYIRPPVEEKENVTLRDSSHLETSIATSDAWITDDGKLNHTLRNKQENLKAKLDTTFVIKYVNKIEEKVVIEEVEKPVKYIPKIYTISLWFSIAIIAFIFGRFILKFKKII